MRTPVHGLNDGRLLALVRLWKRRGLDNRTGLNKPECSPESASHKTESPMTRALPKFGRTVHALAGLAGVRVWLLCFAINSHPSYAGESVLLLGEPTVSHTKHLTQRFIPAQKHSTNPVIRRTEKWEGVGLTYGAFRDAGSSSGELRLWYIAYAPGTSTAEFMRRRGTDYSGTNPIWASSNSKAFQLATVSLGPHPKKARGVAIHVQTPPAAILGVRFTYEGEFISFSRTEFTGWSIGRTPLASAVRIIRMG